MEGFISIPDFMAHLKAEGILMIHAKDLAELKMLERDQKHRDWLKQKTVTVAQAAEILGKSDTTVRRLIDNPKVVPKSEIFMKGNRIKISTHTVKRLRGYE